ncbi:glycosyltransferase [Atrimonas thermophila]|uniref:glycosyltransferase n=1 Tax=Atrimonas thermophila TaxID=3064161 RepID=UPI00399C817D
MKIVMIDPSGFTPSYDHCLGTAIAQQGNQLVIATMEAGLGRWTEEINYECWEHFYRVTGRLSKGKTRTYLKGCEHLFDMERLWHRLRQWEPDVIHFQWLPLPFVDKFFLRKFRKIAPLVLTVHDTEPFHGAPSSRLQLVGLQSAYKQFDHYIVHTQYSKKMLVERLLLSEELVSVISHGVFAYYRKLVDGIRAEQVSQFREKKVLFLGILKPYKGVDILLQAFARLSKQLMKDTVLQIVGYPRIPIEPLQALAQRLGIEDHVFWDLRFVEETEIAAYFSQADVVVLPYRRIDQSGVLMVALAFGKPIIASRVGGFTEILEDGRHGFLVEPNNIDALAYALERILEDDGLRTRMGSEVEKLACGKLSWSNIAARTIQLYQDVLERWRAKHGNQA